LGAALASLFTSIATLWWIPVPLPNGSDEFGYLLQGQTFAQFRLTNPAPALWKFFETQHTLVQPTYTAKFPPAQGMMLAVGYWLGHPLFGVWLSFALFCVATAWMLRGVLPARWALLGVVFAIGQFGLTCYWAQSYWGGAVAAAGGALVFGGTLRVLRRSRSHDAILLGVGGVILMLSRPFEGLLVSLAPAFLVLRHWLIRRGWADRTTLMRLILPCAMVIGLGVLFQIYYNYRVTGSPWTLPYLAYEQRYSGAPLFIWQKAGPPPVFHDKAMKMFYETAVVPNSHFNESVWKTYWTRMHDTLRFHLGLLLGALAVLGAFLRPTPSSRLATAGFLAVSACFVLSYWFGLHYIAPASALLLFAAVHGARSLFLSRPPHRRSSWWLAGLLACYLGLLGSEAAKKYIPPGFYATQRQDIIRRLGVVGGLHVVLVDQRTPPLWHFNWVYNDARIDDSPVVWAHDRGTENNQQLLAYYHDRQAWQLVEEGEFVQLFPYSRHPPGPPSVRPPRGGEIDVRP
jgi:hypothetical protein